MNDLMVIRLNLLREKIEYGQRQIEMIQEMYDRQLLAAQNYVYKCQKELAKLIDSNPQL